MKQSDFETNTNLDDEEMRVMKWDIHMTAFFMTLILVLVLVALQGSVPTA